jgi:hypothetical protein
MIAPRGFMDGSALVKGDLFTADAEFVIGCYVPQPGEVVVINPESTCTPGVIPGRALAHVMDLAVLAEADDATGNPWKRLVRLRLRLIALIDS